MYNSQQLQTTSCCANMLTSPSQAASAILWGIAKVSIGVVFLGTITIVIYNIGA